MSVLVLGPEEKESLKTLREYAETHPMTMDDLLDIINGDRGSAGDFPEFTRNIPVGYRVVFSVEQQVSGDIRHLSISYDKDIPPLEAVELIMGEMGFEDLPDFTRVHIEDIGDGQVAINVLQLIPGSPNRSK